MTPATYSYADVEAAYHVGYSRGASDKRRGPRSGAGKVVYLAAYLRESAGRPCPMNPGEVCPDIEECRNNHHHRAVAVDIPVTLTPEQWKTARAGLPCVVNADRLCTGRGECLQIPTTQRVEA